MPTTQVEKWGNRLAMRIPKAVAQDAQLREGESVQVTVDCEGSLVIKAVRRKYRLSNLVSGITPKDRYEETDWV